MARDISSTQVVPNLVQGVSQQAAPQRRDSQCEAQFDCVNSVLEGAAARPHADLLRLYPSRNLEGGFFTRMEHEGEKYLVGVAPNGAPFAIDLEDGTDCTVTNTAPDLSYLTSGAGTPSSKLRARAVDDFLFIANRRQTVSMAGTTSPAKVNEALIFVRGTNFTTTYTVNLSGPGAAAIALQTADQTVRGTNDIARTLATGAPLNLDILSGSALNGQGGYTVDVYGSLLHVYRADGQAFDIEVSDGNGEEFMYAFNGRASSYSRLPSKGVDGVVLAVKGDKRTGDDDFYVKFTGSPSTGVWDETVGPGVQTTLNAATMPHALVNVGYRTFEFRRLAWSTRIAGDAGTAKDPSFVSKTIRDIMWHQRRLGFVHRSGAVWSKSDFPYTFFPDTLQTLLATAPVDLTISGGSESGSSEFDFAVQTNENLFLWAQGSQFRVTSGDNAFKQDTVENFEAAAFEYSPEAKPLSVGGFLFFTNEVGQYATLRAQLFNAGRLAGDVDVTSHAAQYIPSGVHIMAASETLRYIFVLSGGNLEQLQLFNYTWNGEEFIQAAINTWRFPGGSLLWASVSSNYLYLLQQRPEGVALLRVDMTPGRKDTDPGARYLTRLDLRVSEAGVTGLSHDDEANTSTFTLPYTPDPETLRVVVRQAAGSFTRGRFFPIVNVAGAVVTVKGDLTGIPFYAGMRISAEREESKFSIRGDNGPEPTDRLSVDRFKLSCSNTAYTRIEVSAPNWPTPKVYEFPQRILGGVTATTGEPVPHDDDVDAEVGEDAAAVTIRMINDSPFPSAWQNASYAFTAVGWKGAK